MASYGSIFNFIRKDLGPLEEEFHRRSLTEVADEIDIEDIDNISRNSYFNDVYTVRDFEEEQDDDYENSEESDQDSDSESESENSNNNTTSCLDTTNLLSCNDSTLSKTTNKSLFSPPPKKMFKKSCQDETDSDCSIDNSLKSTDGRNKENNCFVVINNSNITAIDSSCSDSHSDNDILVESSDDDDSDKPTNNNFISGTYCCTSGDDSEEDILADMSY